MVAAGVACAGFEPYDRELIAKDYADAIPIPLAMAKCTSAGDEDLTFEVFADAAARDAFVETKGALVCAAAKRKGPDDFPGTPYVAADAWLVEPDEAETAESLAPVLHGVAAVRRCGA